MDSDTPAGEITVSIPATTSLSTKQFKAYDLQPYLEVITEYIDIAAVAIPWCSSGVIEIHQAQEFLRYGGDECDKSLKVLDVFMQLRKRESRIPLFLRGLLKSGERSATNKDLYGILSKELGFNDDEVERACNRKWDGWTKLLKTNNTSTSSVASSGFESSNEPDRKYSTPVAPLQHYRRQEPSFQDLHYPLSPKSPVEQSSLLQKYNLLQEENKHLHKKLVKTQSKLIDIQQQLITIKNEQQIQQLKASMRGHSRRKSQYSALTAAENQRQRRFSLSVDNLPLEYYKDDSD